MLKEDGSANVLDNTTEKHINKLENRMEALQMRLTRIDETLNEIEVQTLHYTLLHKQFLFHFVVHY